jgi:hypothetical protein
MTDFNYKKYSLEKLEEWMHDAMSCDETTPQDIFDVIKGVVEENYYHHKHHTGRAYELLALLNGNGHLSCDKNDPSPECEGAWNSFWEEETPKSTVDKVVKWVLPVEQDLGSDDYYVNFPDDLLEAANLHPGDEVEWVDNNDGTFILRKPSAV